MNKEQQFEAEYIRLRQAKTEEAFKHINRFLEHNTDGQSPLQLLHDLLVHDSENMSDGTSLMLCILEDLIRFFLQPENSAAFKSSAITSPKTLASVLVQMHWFFQEMDRPFTMGHLNNFYLEQYADDEEIASLTHKYKKLAEIEEATATICASYQQAA